MHKPHIFLAGITLLALTVGGFTLAQEAPQGNAAKRRKKDSVSPHETKTWTIQGKKITISYGRPYKKGRVIFGGLEPWGKVWRTGADDATTFTTASDVMVGPLHVVAGTYGLFTIPNEKEWTLILNKVWDQWGAFRYDQSQDYARTPMKVEKSPSPIEQLTIDIESKGGDMGLLKIMWDDTVASVPIQVH